MSALVAAEAAEENSKEISNRDLGSYLDGEQTVESFKKLFDQPRLSFINAMNGWQIT